MKPLAYWLLAARPKTLSLALTPVLVGNALAWTELHELDWLILLATLAAALLIQIGTNLHNDAADFERGIDRPDRIGPPRVTAQGWLSARQVRRGAVASFTGAFAVGIYLVAVGGWPILVIGLLSIAAGYTYTGGRRPIAYSAGGELFVFVFFGLLAVSGSHYLQAGYWSPAALLLGTALGPLAAAVLLINNYRDLDTDRRANRRTLCHYLGRQSSRLIFAGMLLLPFLLPLAQEVLPPQTRAWFVLGVLPVALLLVRRLFQEPPGPWLNRLLAATARLQLGYAVLLVAGLPW